MYLHTQGSAPVLIGEFGTKNETTSDRQWFKALRNTIKEQGLNWTFWCWNPNSGDTGGILLDDWRSVHEEKQAVLETIQYPLIGSGNPVPDPEPNPDPDPDPEPEPEPNPDPDPEPEPEPAGGDCRISYEVRSQWPGGFTTDINIANVGETPIDGWTLSWTFPEDQRVSHLWCGDAVQEGHDVTVNSLDWNDAISPKGSVKIGFNGAYGDTNPVPSAFWLNGERCELR